MSKTLKVSECKAKFLAVAEQVARTGERVVVTKRGEPLVDVVPHQSARKNAFGILKGQIEITGDIISPIDVEWEALK
jgi:prevent-host-death family protein